MLLWMFAYKLLCAYVFSSLGCILRSGSNSKPNLSKKCQTGFQRGSMFFIPTGDVKNLPSIAGDTGNVCSIPGSERSPAGEKGNPLQHSCLQNPKDRGAW